MFLDGQCLRGPHNFTGILRMVWDGFGNDHEGDEHVHDSSDVDVGVSKNNGTPKSSILIGFFPL